MIEVLQPTCARQRSSNRLEMEDVDTTPGLPGLPGLPKFVKLEKNLGLPVGCLFGTSRRRTASRDLLASWPAFLVGLERLLCALCNSTQLLRLLCLPVSQNLSKLLNSYYVECVLSRPQNLAKAYRIMCSRRVFSALRVFEVLCEM